MQSHIIAKMSHFLWSKSHTQNKFKKPKPFPTFTTAISSENIWYDVEGGLLRNSSTFPYFMLVALEGGSFLRGLILLLIYPIISCFSKDFMTKVMIMVSFCGLKKEKFVVGRAVLPKFFLEDVGLEGFVVLKNAKKRVCISKMPRIMVESFLKEYLKVDTVVGKELKVFLGFYTGLVEETEKNIQAYDSKDDCCFIGVVSSSTSLNQSKLFSHCKVLFFLHFYLLFQIFLVTEAEKKRWHPLPREKYPKPLIFHDGRIAFTPTPINTLYMYIWLPVAFPLAIIRLVIGITLPYKLSTLVLSSVSTDYKLKGPLPATCPKQKGRLFVCNHRTLFDPIYISVALNKPVTAVTYSLSRLSEVLSPIKTVRLTRNREKDGKMIEKYLSRGNSVVVCPEGTTCREPYLLRFSPLFSELTDEIVPVAIDVKFSMFYATTAGGFKAFDSIYYLMNPRMCYELEFLDSVDTSGTRNGKESSIKMANFVQGMIGKALGFECTNFSRKDKYMMLAGNSGIVVANGHK